MASSSRCAAGRRSSAQDNAFGRDLLLPSRPLASEIGFTRFRHYSLAEVGNIRLRLRVASEASRVGGLHLLRARGCPPPLTPPRHSLRSRGGGNGEEAVANDSIRAKTVAM